MKINASAAHARDAKVLGAPWSPPAYMKDNTNVVHGSLPSQYAAYANYLNQAATSIGLDYVSLRNEPGWNPDYEGCVWNGTQFETFCANNAQVITKPIVIPEAVNFNNSMSDPTLNDPLAVTNISIVAGHFYGGGNSVHQKCPESRKARLGNGTLSHRWQASRIFTLSARLLSIRLELTPTPTGLIHWYCPAISRMEQQNRAVLMVRIPSSPSTPIAPVHKSHNLSGPYTRGLVATVTAPPACALGFNKTESASHNRLGCNFVDANSWITALLM